MTTPPSLPIPSRSESLQYATGGAGVAGAAGTGTRPPPTSPSHTRAPRSGEVVRRTLDDGLTADEYHRESGFVVVEGADDDGGSRVASWFRSVFTPAAGARDRDTREKDGRHRRKNSKDARPGSANASDLYSAGHPHVPTPRSHNHGQSHGTESRTSSSTAASLPFLSRPFLGSPARASTSSRDSNASSHSNPTHEDDYFTRAERRLPKLPTHLLGRSASDSGPPSAVVVDSNPGSAASSPLGPTGMNKLLEIMKTGLQKAPSADVVSAATDALPPRASLDQAYSYVSGSADLFPGLAPAGDREPGVDAPASRRTSLNYGPPAPALLQPTLSVKHDSLRRKASPIPSLSRARSSKNEIKVLHATPWGRPIDPVRQKEDSEFIGAMRTRKWDASVAPMPTPVPPTRTIKSGSAVTVAVSVTISAAPFSDAPQLVSAASPAPKSQPASALVSPADSVSLTPADYKPDPISVPSILPRKASVVEREEKEKRFESMLRTSRLASMEGVLVAEDDEEMDIGEADADVADVGEDEKPLPYAPDEDGADTLLEPPPLPVDASVEKEPEKEKEAPKGKPPTAPNASLVSLLATSKIVPIPLTITAASLPRSDSASNSLARSSSSLARSTSSLASTTFPRTPPSVDLPPTPPPTLPIKEAQQARAAGFSPLVASQTFSPEPVEVPNVPDPIVRLEPKPDMERI